MTAPEARRGLGVTFISQAVDCDDLVVGAKQRNP
jgi:hypothetical protein